MTAHGKRTSSKSVNELKDKNIMAAEPSHHEVDNVQVVEVCGTALTYKPILQSHGWVTVGGDGSKLPYLIRNGERFIPLSVIERVSLEIPGAISGEARSAADEGLLFDDGGSSTPEPLRHTELHPAARFGEILAQGHAGGCLRLRRFL